MTHLLSIVVLLLKITGTKSCRGACGGFIFHSDWDAGRKPATAPLTVLCLVACFLHLSNSL